MTGIITNNLTGKYLITTDNWFYAPDGKQYKAVWGETSVIEDSFLGIKTNARSSNWFTKVGTENNHVIIAGCQIHYACKCDSIPITNSIDVTINDGIEKIEEKPYSIYLAK
jgi:hypothetical protein